MTEDTAFRARSRAQSLLLRAAGTPLQALAEASQVHRVTVSAWIKPWAPHGAQSLPDPPRSGRPRPRTPDDQARAHHSSTAAPRALQTVVARCAHPTAKRLSLSTRQRLATTARRRWTRGRTSCKRLRDPQALARGHRALAAWPTHEAQGKRARASCDDAGLALAPTMPSAWPEPQRVIELPARREGRIKG